MNKLFYSLVVSTALLGVGMTADAAEVIPEKRGIV